MAISRKTGREYQSRFERGLRIERLPKKSFDRWGYPIICGLKDDNGIECRTKVSSYGLCDEHYEERMRKLGLWTDRPELFEKRST